MTRKHRNVSVWATVMLFVVAGCEASDEEADSGAPSDSVPTTIRAPAAPSEPPDSAADTSSAGPVLSAELGPQAGTDVVGSASLSPGGDGTTVSVEILGANGGYPYVAELVGGSCASPAGVIATLGEITTDAEGDGEFHGVLDGTLLAADQASRAVRVRGASDPAAIVACGNLGASAQ